VLSPKSYLFQLYLWYNYPIPGHLFLPRGAQASAICTQLLAAEAVLGDRGVSLPVGVLRVLAWDVASVAWDCLVLRWEGFLRSYRKLVEMYQAELVGVTGPVHILLGPLGEALLPDGLIKVGVLLWAAIVCVLHLLSRKL